MDALDFAVTVVAFAMSRNNRDEIHLAAMRAGQIDQNVLLCVRCPHVAPLPTLYRKETPRSQTRRSGVLDVLVLR